MEDPGFRPLRLYLLAAAFVLLSIIVVSITSLLTSAEYVVGFSLAYYSGVSMIFLPCTFPLVLVIISLVGMMKEVKKGLLTALLYGLGVAISMSLIGLAMGGVGQLFGINKGTRVTWAVGGTAAVFLALSQLEILRTHFTSVDIGLGRLIRKNAIYLSSFLFGMALGDAGIGCPNPAFFVLMSYVASVRDIVQGAILGFLHGMGRATPLLFFGIVAMLGGAAASRRSLIARKASLNTIFNYVFLAIGAFFLSIAIFGGWWCNSSIHHIWDSLIVSLGGYRISEQAAPHAKLEEVTVGWPLGPWLITAIVVGTFILHELKAKSKRREAAGMSGENLLLVISAFTMVLVVSIAYMPLASLLLIAEHEIAMADAGVLSLLAFGVGAALLKLVSRKREVMQAARVPTETSH